MLGDFGFRTVWSRSAGEIILGMVLFFLGSLDYAAVFSIAQNMRADLNGMTAVKDSLKFGKSALTVARDAATQISDELGRLKQTMTQGQQQGRGERGPGQSWMHGRPMGCGQRRSIADAHARGNVTNVT